MRGRAVPRPPKGPKTGKAIAYQMVEELGHLEEMDDQTGTIPLRHHSPAPGRCGGRDRGCPQ